MRKLMFLLSLSCLIGETAFEQESASETCTRRFHYGLDFSFSQKPDLDVSGGAWFKVLKQEAAVLLGVKQHKGKGVAIVEGKERELSTVTAFGTLLAEFKVFTFGKRLPKKGDDAFMGKILVVPYVSTNAVRLLRDRRQGGIPHERRLGLGYRHQHQQRQEIRQRIHLERRNIGRSLARAVPSMSFL
ncbi:MAG: hypothetical protein WDN09_01050 [bacterium]